jgi:hypothetical protein
MSFASILSEPATKAIPQEKVPLGSKSSQMPAADSPSVKVDDVKMEVDHTMPMTASRAHATAQPVLNGREPSISDLAPKLVLKPRKSLTAKENESISRAMEALESQSVSDVEESDFPAERERYAQKSRKRALELDDAENIKRKVRTL